MQRPLPGHPEFSVIDRPGHREYRIENWHISSDDTGKVAKQAAGLTWRWAIVPVLFSLAPAFGSRWLVLLTVATALLVTRNCTQVVDEAVLVIPPHGVQLETRRGFSNRPIFVSRRFIPLTTLRDVIINEGLRGWNVRYYLAAVREHPSGRVSLEVAFEGILPRLPVLLEVYHGVHDLLLDGVGEKGRN